MRSGIVLRDITKAECSWLDKTIKAETVVFEYSECNYGVISEAGIAICLSKDYVPIEVGGATLMCPPRFYEVPKDSILWSS